MRRSPVSTSLLVPARMRRFIASSPRALLPQPSFGSFPLLGHWTVAFLQRLAAPPLWQRRLRRPLRISQWRCHRHVSQWRCQRRVQGPVLVARGGQPLLWNYRSRPTLRRQCSFRCGLAISSRSCTCIQVVGRMGAFWFHRQAPSRKSTPCQLVGFQSRACAESRAR